MVAAQPEGGAEAAFRLGDVPLCVVDHAEIVVRIGIVGVETQRLPLTCKRFSDLIDREQRKAEIGPGFGQVGICSQGLAVEKDCLLDLVAEVKLKGVPVQRGGIVAEKGLRHKTAGCEDLYPMQDLIPEFFHFRFGFRRVAPFEVEVERSDAEMAQCGDIADRIVDRAGEQPAVAVASGGRLIGMALHPVSDGDGSWVAPGLGNQGAKPRDAGGKPR